MFKQSIILGAVGGVLAGVAALIYQRVYTSSLGEGFPAIVTPVNIFATCIAGSLAAGAGHWLLHKWLKRTGVIIFNFLLTILSFASILSPFAAKLPLDVEMPELFPGLAVPMHFFPALAWFTLKPLFIRSAE